MTVRSKRWIAGLGLALVILLVAVSRWSPRPKDQEPMAIIHTTLPERIATSTAEGGLPTEAPPPAGDGSLVLTVRDQSGRTPEGIPVSLEGPVQGVWITDSNGQITLTLRAAFYAARVMDGCYDRLQVLQGGSARLGIAAGDTTTGDLSVLWHHRYAPAAPVHSTYTPHWPMGRETKIRFTVVDRCKDGERAPNVSFAPFEFQHDDRIVIEGQPQLSADSDGNGNVTVRCQREGPVKLWLVDRSNPDDFLDLADKSSDSGLQVECKNL